MTRHVLFVCLHNAGRSQMAQAFFERDAPDGWVAESAGTAPREAISPTAIEAMAEAGIDISGRVPQSLTVEIQRRADHGVTMGCGDACPFVPAPVEDWELPDPAEMPLEGVREVRDEIERRVADLIARLS